jgi:hypothetical protein
MNESILVTLLTLAAIVGAASTVAVVAGVLSRIAGSHPATATLKAGAAFAGTAALLLSIAIAVKLI